MAHPESDSFEQDIPKTPWVYWGFVTDNQDPDKRGRVRVRVPGVLEPQSVWAWTLMPGQGTPTEPRRGLFSVPAVGSCVVVAFIQGATEEPIVLGSIPPPDTSSKQPYAGLAKDKVPEVLSLAMGQYSIVINGDTTKPRLYIVDQGTSTTASLQNPLLIHFNGTDRVLTIKGQVTLDLGSTGRVNINGTRVEIQGRPVLPNGRPL